jgi:hypothetical protein
MRDEERVDQQGADVVRRVDRDDLVLELADGAYPRSALGQERQDVRLQEGGFRDDAQVGLWRVDAELVLDVGDVVSRGDVVLAVHLVVHQVLGGRRRGLDRHDRHVQALGGEQALVLGDVEAGRVDGRERVDDDVRLLGLELRCAAPRSAGAASGRQHRDRGC